MVLALASPTDSVGHEVGILGGPGGSEGVFLDERGALSGMPGLSPALGSRPDQPNPRADALLVRGLLAEHGSPFGADRAGMITYQVAQNDTIPGVAARFGVSAASIIGLNPALRGRAPRAGERITIPPVSGALHVVAPGETVEMIAAEYGVALAEVRARNRGVDLAALDPESKIFVPGATPSVGAASGKSLPEIAGYFVSPADGFNWGRLHRYNAVDIANRCGTPIRATADGLVIDAGRSEWGGGYGHLLVLEHPNGVRTKYAHLDELRASLGDYVRQGATIATMGKTGEATGCHLHFEVEGAKNPFVRE